jgi:hypothetical protein
MNRKNLDTAWQSCLVMMELSFQFGFELTFNDPMSDNFVIQFFKYPKEVAANNLWEKVISLN